MRVLIKPFCFTAALSSDFCSARRRVGRQLSRERDAIIVCKGMPLKRTARNCTKVVSVQKTGPPVLRNEKTAEIDLNGQKETLASSSNAQHACISSCARPEIFWSYHFTRQTHTLCIILSGDDESGIFDFNRSCESHIFWRGADWFPAFSRSDQLVELTTWCIIISFLHNRW